MDLVDDGKFQEVRSLLSEFVFEVVIWIISLLFVIYFDVIFVVMVLFDEGKIDEVMMVFNVVLSIQVVIEIVIVLFLFRVVVMIEKVKVLFNDDGKVVDDKVVIEVNDKVVIEGVDLMVVDYVVVVCQEIEIVEVFGYGCESDFEDLYEVLNELDC